MIEFSGELSGACRRYVLRRSAILKMMPMLFALIVVGLILCPIVLPLLNVAWYFAPFLCIPLVLVWVLSELPIRKKNLDRILPVQLTVTEDGDIISRGAAYEEIMTVEGVNRVLDFGEWYHISFGLIADGGHFVCQKSLISQGTIEAFEGLFEGKFVKK